MRRFFGFLTCLAAASSLVAFTHMAGQGAPILLRADQLVYRGDPAVVVKWTDTNSQTVVRTDVRRRSIIADTAVTHGPADTLWTIRCQTTGRPDSVNATLRARGSCKDDGVVYGRTYRYQARDSISGAALTGWSDSVTSVVTDFRRAQ